MKAIRTIGQVIGPMILGAAIMLGAVTYLSRDWGGEAMANADVLRAVEACVRNESVIKVYTNAMHEPVSVTCFVTFPVGGDK